MFKRSVFLTLTVLALCATARQAAAACISATNTPNKMGRKTVFDVGGDTFGADLKIKGGMFNAADARAAAAEMVAIAKALGVIVPMPDIPADNVYVIGNASAHLNFFGKGLTLLDLGPKASRSSGSFSKKFAIEVAGIDLYSGTNSLSDTMKNVGPYTMPFYTVGTNYSGVYASGTILGEIGMSARAHAASDSLLVDGRSWVALVLEGAAGVSVGVAGVGLFADVDLLEAGVNYTNSVGLTSGSSYDFFNSYDARTLDGKVALKASAFGGSVTLWDGSWNGTTLATRTLYDVNGCVQ